ncbi:MAG: amine oxidase, partial [Chloroflexi bacterium]|nr:amine oxidase [Chloroflexota bacterium]
QPLSAYLNNHTWHRWQRMLLMYCYSIPYAQITDFPAEMAMPILRTSGAGTKWTRVVGGVYTYIEKILAGFDGAVYCDVRITAVKRHNEGVQLSLATGDELDFDKVVFATPPDQTLKLLADPTEAERKRFENWKANHATTTIHTDLGLYKHFGSQNFSEFDVFEKANGDAGYNAYLNRLCGLPEAAPHYNLAYNLMDRLDPAQIIQQQAHHTPLYTTTALRFRDEVIAANGAQHTYHAGAYLDNGLHEGAVNSG